MKPLLAAPLLGTLLLAAGPVYAQAVQPAPAPPPWQGAGTPPPPPPPGAQAADPYSQVVVDPSGQPVMVAPPGQVAPPAPAPPASPGARFTGTLAGGFRYMAVDTLPFLSGEVSVFLGVHLNSMQLGAELMYYRGETIYGVPQHQGTIGFHIAGVIDRFRVGGGVAFGYLSIERASRDATMSTYTFGVNALATFDFVRFGDRGEHGVFVGLRLGWDWIGDDMYQLGVVPHLGLRY